MEVALLLAVVVVVMLVVVAVLVMQIRPDEPSNIASLFAAEVRHEPQTFCAKDDAPENIFCMWITLATSHFEMSQLNDDAW